MAYSPATPSTVRGLDAIAANAQLRRLARAAEPPWLHREVARRMAERLSIVKLQPARVIDWWSFLGAGGELLAQAYPDAARTAVEPDESLRARSADKARRPWWARLGRGSAASPVLCEHDTLPAGARLVWANMMLHAVIDPPRLIARWRALLDADGFVMFSCLGPGTLAQLRDLYARLGWGAATPTFVDMHDLGDMLVEAGFADPVMDQETLTLQWADAPALLAELRSLGGNAHPQRFAGLRTPRWRSRLIGALETLRRVDGRLALDFEIVYGHAFAGAPRLRAGEATTVPLADMRSMLRAGRGRASR